MVHAGPAPQAVFSRLVNCCFAGGHAELPPQHAAPGSSTTAASGALTCTPGQWGWAAARRAGEPVPWWRGRRPHLQRPAGQLAAALQRPVALSSLKKMAAMRQGSATGSFARGAMQKGRGAMCTMPVLHWLLGMLNRPVIVREASLPDFFQSAGNPPLPALHASGQRPCPELQGCLPAHPRNARAAAQQPCT